MAIEIVDFPIKHGGSFHSYVNVYQRVSHQILHGLKTWICLCFLGRPEEPEAVATCSESPSSEIAQIIEPFASALPAVRPECFNPQTDVNSKHISEPVPEIHEIPHEPTKQWRFGTSPARSSVNTRSLGLLL
jgi:hypothetical protein